jgi:hypothetical protein
VTDTPVERDKSEPEIKVKVEPFGPTTEELAEIGERVIAQARVRKFLGRSRARMLYVETLEDLDEKPRRPRPPNRFRATMYDDTNRRAVFADGSLDDLRSLTLNESAIPPPPSGTEFAAAVNLVRRDDTLGAAVAAGRLEPYQPIPALHLVELPDGRFERRIAVGLLPRDAGESHSIVAVDVAGREIIHVDDAFGEAGTRPQHLGSCGVPHDANQSTASKGTAGQVWVTVSQGGQTLWRFLAVRPAASSGTNGSGIELRYVDYKGKRVLYRAHVPILNVKYNANACGPYRDWQYQEGMIQAQGIDVAPGFRFSSGPALTIMDTGSDTGNFLGVGIYVLFNEVVFVSEMEAGWYRYITQWRLGTNGTIRPRFGFAAVEHPCVCNVHHHHVYWRLDFDIRTAGNNRVREFNDPPLIGNQNWHTKRFEIRRPRDLGRARRWRVENTRTREGYDIVPQLDDGLAATMPDAPFGRGDVWILRYRGSEIDDGVVAIGPPYEANIDSWVNGEAVDDHDVVVWYGAHFTHDVSHLGPALHGHVLGPDLKPINW